MGNILYLTDHDLNDNSGVSRKVITQSAIWREMGNNVDVYHIAAGKNSTSSFQTFMNLMKASRLLWFIKKDSSYDLVYSRTFLWNPWLQAIFKRFPTVIEINGLISSELKGRSKITWLYGILTHFLFIRNVRGIVCVSKELTQYYQLFGKPITTIANGGPSDQVRQIYKELRPQVVFIGTNHPWHGLDKFLFLVKHCPDFDFHLIGFPNIQSYPNLVQHGVIDHPRATTILMKCHVGISSLALHRAGINEASPLKSREYLSCGVACIIAHEDTDLHHTLDFVLKIENCDSNVEQSLEEMRSFIRRCATDKMLENKIRDYYQKKLSWQIKETERFKFFKYIGCL